MIRLLHLRASGQLTEGQWCSLLNLESHRDDYRAAQGPNWEGVEAGCRLIRDGTGTDVDEDVLQNLICSVWTSPTMSLISFPEPPTLSFEVTRCLKFYGAYDKAVPSYSTTLSTSLRSAVDFVRPFC